LVRTGKASTWVHQHCFRTIRMFGGLAHWQRLTLSFEISICTTLITNHMSCPNENIASKRCLGLRTECGKAKHGDKSVVIYILCRNPVIEQLQALLQCFSGLVVKLAVAILRFDPNPRATSASPVFDSRLMQIFFLLLRGSV
jgi:hypothetical protein